MESSDNEGVSDLFQEPLDYYAPEKQPTQAHHRTLGGQELTLRLVGHSPLWVGEGLAFVFLIPSSITRWRG